MQFAFEECKVVLLHGILNRVMVWIKCLDEHTPREIAAPRAPRYLGQQLKCAFRGAKVR